jgi:hypothetical protein
MKIYQCLNDKRLLISKSIDNDFFYGKNITTGVVLLTAWNSENINMGYWRGIVRFFIGKGCRFFICLGVSSEELHDVIDECLYEYDDEYEEEISADVITTYHNNESVEDVINFFIYSTEVKNINSDFLLAYLDDFCELDLRVKNVLLSECK